MICENCKKRTATQGFQMVKGYADHQESVQVNVCDECAPAVATFISILYDMFVRRK